MIIITVGVDYPPLGRSLLTLEKPLAPFWSVSLGLMVMVPLLVV